MDPNRVFILFSSGGSHYHRSRTQRNVRPLLRNPRSRPSHCPRSHSRATSISPRREPLVGGTESRAHYDRRAAHPCRPDTNAPEDARSRQETCHDRRTAVGKFWPSRPANHRARTPAPHFALAALQSSKRIRRRPSAHPSNSPPPRPTPRNCATISCRIPCSANSIATNGSSSPLATQNATAINAPP
jgi:hypothetical protein